jgi:N-methylhydantoinase A
MEEEGRAMLDAAGVPPERRALQRSADCRYRRQAYELAVPLADGKVTAASLAALAADFHAKHEQTYGHSNTREPVQLVNLRLTALGRLPPLTLAQPSDVAAARHSERPAWFAGAMRPCRVLWREGLSVGAAVPGPAIIEALESTTVVPPGWKARVSDHGIIRLVRER